MFSFMLHADAQLQWDQEDVVIAGDEMVTPDDQRIVLQYLEAS